MAPRDPTTVARGRPRWPTWRGEAGRGQRRDRTEMGSGLAPGARGWTGARPWSRVEPGRRRKSCGSSVPRLPQPRAFAETDEQGSCLTTVSALWSADGPPGSNSQCDLSWNPSAANTIIQVRRPRAAGSERDSGRSERRRQHPLREFGESGDEEAGDCPTSAPATNIARTPPSGEDADEPLRAWRGGRDSSQRRRCR